MIEHVVLVKFGEKTTQEQIQEVINRLKQLKGKISGIVDLQAGLNFSDRSQGYQVGLTVRFDDRAALEAYGPHPEHQAVVAYTGEVGRTDITVVDFEI